jgi:hypothetical protein
LLVTPLLTQIPEDNTAGGDVGKSFSVKLPLEVLEEFAEQGSNSLDHGTTT